MVIVDVLLCFLLLDEFEVLDMNVKVYYLIRIILVKMEEFKKEIVKDEILQFLVYKVM